MAAIVELALAMFPASSPFELPSPGRTVAIFGFLYLDTIKALSKICRCECRIYKCDVTEVNRLEADLASGLHINALFTEFPGNPLLQTPDLGRLQCLAERYHFALVVDDTLSTCVNVNIISACDAICTSLSKMFSGACDVMGGSIILSPTTSFRGRLQGKLGSTHRPDAWFCQDADIMELNSRHFPARCRLASSNAQKMARQLKEHETVDEVYYPWGSPSQRLYDKYKVHDGGYGFLISIRFKTPSKAKRFYDALETCKGPSLGTNFTLACAYTLLAHYNELPWAAEYGVVEHLVRISVGIESEEWLALRVRKALRAATSCLE
ncbi:hypothetical protein OQA88_7416 [Cercophora sp. LCS_1]